MNSIFEIDEYSLVGYLSDDDLSFLMTDNSKEKGGLMGDESWFQ